MVSCGHLASTCRRRSAHIRRGTNEPKLYQARWAVVRFAGCDRCRRAAMGYCTGCGENCSMWNGRAKSPFRSADRRRPTWGHTVGRPPTIMARRGVIWVERGDAIWEVPKGGQAGSRRIIPRSMSIMRSWSRLQRLRRWDARRQGGGGVDRHARVKSVALEVATQVLDTTPDRIRFPLSCRWGGAFWAQDPYSLANCSATHCSSRAK